MLGSVNSCRRWCSLGQPSLSKKRLSLRFRANLQKLQAVEDQIFRGSRPAGPIFACQKHQVSITITSQEAAVNVPSVRAEHREQQQQPRLLEPSTVSTAFFSPFVTEANVNGVGI